MKRRKAESFYNVKNRSLSLSKNLSNENKHTLCLQRIGIWRFVLKTTKTAVFVFITEILWQTIWRNNWQPVFWRCKNTALMYQDWNIDKIFVPINWNFLYIFLDLLWRSFWGCSTKCMIRMMKFLKTLLSDEHAKLAKIWREIRLEQSYVIKSPP